VFEDLIRHLICLNTGLAVLLDQVAPNGRLRGVAERWIRYCDMDATLERVVQILLPVGGQEQDTLKIFEFAKEY
jgi:hypothetical protein